MKPISGYNNHFAYLEPCEDMEGKEPVYYGGMAWSNAGPGTPTEFHDVYELMANRDTSNEVSFLDSDGSSAGSVSKEKGNDDGDVEEDDLEDEDVEDIDLDRQVMPPPATTTPTNLDVMKGISTPTNFIGTNLLRLQSLNQATNKSRSMMQPPTGMESAASADYASHACDSFIFEQESTVGFYKAKAQSFWSSRLRSA